ncbi:MAG: RtcB family protein [Planctomycetia bacterium]|nr:RtcB family protein [Planctomycetia bacterium]
MNYLNIIPKGPATGILPVEGLTPVQVIGNEKIRKTLEDECLQQIINTRRAPGISAVVLNPDAHIGFGAPIGCVMVSPDHIYPAPVGVDVKCSMSLLQFDLPTDALAEKPLRRALINAIEARTATGRQSTKQLKKAPKFSDADAELAILEGASEEVCERLGIPQEWRGRCEDFQHTAQDGTFGEGSALQERLEFLKSEKLFRSQEAYSTRLRQLGTYGGGNHFGECEDVVLADETPETRHLADVFGLKPGCAAFLSHCGSRGFGNLLATNQFRLLRDHFERWHIPFPSGERDLVYAPIGTPEAENYLNDMALAGNFATVNHLLLNRIVLEAFQEVLPGVEGKLVYYISHNFVRREPVTENKSENGSGNECEIGSEIGNRGPNGDGNRMVYVHRKGATCAFPAGHAMLKNTPFYETGHPILLPGNPTSGSSVMVALPDAEKTFYSINHGAGRILGRRAAKKALDQKTVNGEFDSADILTNCRQYPLDEAPAAYKDFNDVLHSVQDAGLAREVARLHARFVIKDASSPADD